MKKLYIISLVLSIFEWSLIYIGLMTREHYSISLSDAILGMLPLLIQAFAWTACAIWAYNQYKRGHYKKNV